MTLVEQRDAAVAALKAIEDAIAAEEREITEEEIALVGEKGAEIEALDTKIKAADEATAKLKALGTPAPRISVKESSVEDQPALTLGEHFVKSAGERLKSARAMGGQWSVASTEFKASTDTQSRPASAAPWSTQLLPGVQAGFRRPLVVDLFSQAQVSGTAISYLVEGAVEGSAASVAEAGAKPQVHTADPTVVTETLSKLAAFIKFTDEMIEDYDFIVSHINGQLLYNLATVEETQVLSGNGTSPNVSGLLDRAGLLTELSAGPDDNAEAVFRAINEVRLATGLEPDALLINPADYQILRLAKDANGQYFGGGYFQGQYGNGGIMENPPVWGLRTVVSPAIASGTAVVGAFKSATVLRKGGVRVESTNSHASDFTNNLVTVRAEERLGLMVPRPSAFNVVTFDHVAA